MVDDLTGPGAPLPPLIAIPADLRSLGDYQRRAEAHLEPATWRHIQAGAGSDRAVRDNRAAFDRYRLLPSVLADLRGGTSAISLFGRRHAAPILAAPIAYQRLAHPDGELATARAAAAIDTGAIVSTLSSVPLEEVAIASRGAAREMARPAAPLWFQLYCQPEREDSLSLVRRAEAAGYEALVVTIDAAFKRSDFPLPAGVDAANLRGMPRASHTTVAGGPILFGTPLADHAPRWEDIAWLRSATRLPLLLKGLVTGPDLETAIGMGVDGIILSNHGGRVLDAFPAALDLLPDVARRVADRIPILVDGDIRSGTDIALALALGASAVLVGRPILHALAVAGMIGVAHMLHILRSDLELAMAQLGCATVDALGDRHLLRR